MEPALNKVHIAVLTVLLCILGVLTTGDQQSAALSCNGSPDFCDLRFDQITFAGSHSAGSGFDGAPKFCDGGEANPCVFRNQDRSISEQLSLGIRYLSLDICYLPQGCNASSYGDLGASRLVSCKGNNADIRFDGFAYGGSFMNILRQVNEWMKSNTGEVIGIHFTSNIPEQGRDVVFNSLVSLLETMWGPGRANSSDSDIEMSMYYSSNSNSWPTLKEAVRMNQRIFIFVDSGLNVGTIKPWINPTPFSTLQSQGWRSTCSDIFEHASRCNITEGDDRQLVIAIGYTLAVCISNGQEACNENLRNATEICYGFRYRENRTVNVLLVNFPNLNSDPVFEVVSDLNERNVQRFLSDNRPTTLIDGSNPTIATDGSTGTASTLSSSTSIASTLSSSTSIASTLSSSTSISLLVAAFVLSA